MTVCEELGGGAMKRQPYIQVPINVYCIGDHYVAVLDCGCPPSIDIPSGKGGTPEGAIKALRMVFELRRRASNDQD